MVGRWDNRLYKFLLLKVNKPSSQNTLTFFFAAPSSFLNANHLWYFKSFGNNSVIDQLRGCKLHLEGGALVTNTSEKGLVADTNGGWVSLKETNGY